MKYRLPYLLVLSTILLIPDAVAVEYSYYEYHANQRLNDISGRNDSSIWVVGDGGLVLHYDGSAWRQEESGTDRPLTSVSAIDDTHAYAVGYDTCLFRDEGQWKHIGSLIGVSKVEAIPSGESWALAGGVLYRLDGLNWEPMSLLIKGTLVSFSAIEPDNIWLLSSDASLEGINAYVYHYSGDTITEYQAYSCKDTILSFDVFGGDIYALDNENVWASYAFSYQYYLNPHAYSYPDPLLYFNGKDWAVQQNSALYNRIARISGNDLSHIYATSLQGVSRIVGGSMTLTERTLDSVSSILVSGSNTYWMLEGNTICHYADWPVEKKPAGVKITGTYEWSGPVERQATVEAAVQPSGEGYDVYLLANQEKSLQGTILSILPNGLAVPGIHRYGCQRDLLSEPIRRTVLGFEPENVPPHYWLGIFLMPSGKPFDIGHALSCEITETYEQYLYK